MSGLYNNLGVVQVIDCATIEHEASVCKLFLSLARVGCSGQCTISRLMDPSTQPITSKSATIPHVTWQLPWQWAALPPLDVVEFFTSSTETVPAVVQTLNDIIILLWLVLNCNTCLGSTVCCVLLGLFVTSCSLLLDFWVVGTTVLARDALLLLLLLAVFYYILMERILLMRLVPHRLLLWSTNTTSSGCCILICLCLSFISVSSSANTGDSSILRRWEQVRLWLSSFSSMGHVGANTWVGGGRGGLANCWWIWLREELLLLVLTQCYCILMSQSATGIWLVLMTCIVA